MGTSLHIKSNRDGAFLSIDRAIRPDFYRTELSYESMTATVEFYEIGLRPMSAFFSELAAAWRGWENERRWGSLEGELNLCATHNGLGTIALVAELRSGVYMEEGATWGARGILFLDSGALDHLARSAALLAG
jgi:hypothetical protein